MNVKAPNNLFNRQALINEQPLSEYLPYSHHYDKATIQTKDNMLLRIFQIKGVSYETANDEHINKWHRQLHQFIMQNGDTNVTFWSHMIKERDDAPDYADVNSGFARRLDKAYKDKLVKDNFFRFSLFFTIVVKSSSFKIPLFEKKINSLHTALESLNEQLDNISQQFVRLDTEPRQLETYERDNVVYSEPLSVLSRLISGTWEEIPLGRTEARKLIARSRINIGKETLEFRTATDTFYGAAFGLKDYPSETNPLTTSELLSLPFPFILSQSYEPIEKQVALKDVKKSKRLLKMTDDDATDQIDDIDLLISDIASRRVGMGNHNLSLFVYTDSDLNNLPNHEENKTIRAQLKQRVSTAIRVIGDMNCFAVREDLALNSQLFAMMPGNFKYRPRPSPISSANFCGFFPMHSVPTGRWQVPHWGESVTQFKTRANTLYDFNFHVGSSDIGHTLIFGGSGAGKTTLQSFTLSQAEKLNAKVICLDYKRSCDIFIRASGGAYRSLKRGQSSGLNPYGLPPTKENIDFLISFTLLLAYPGLDAPAKIENNVAEIIFRTLGKKEFPKHLRTFEQLYSEFQDEDLRDRLLKWKRGNQNGWLFDNDEDNLYFESPFIGVDTTSILDDKILSPPFFYYITHRVKELYGSRFVLSLEEMWKMISHPIFYPWIQKELKLMRSMGGIFVGSTQETNDVDDSPIASTIRGQCQTRIFLPNLEANREVYNKFNISDIEFGWVLEADPKWREFLLKQGRDSVILTADLSGLDDEIAILSGRESNLPVMEQCIEETSNIPEDWLPLYYQRYNTE